jgi:hypothetical protein
MALAAKIFADFNSRIAAIIMVRSTRRLMHCVEKEW